MSNSKDETSQSTYVRPLLPYNEYFGNSRILAELLRDEEKRPWLTSMPQDPAPHKHVVWLGCSVVRTVHIAESLDDILTAISVDHVTLGGPSHCCGIVHDQRKDHDVGRNMLRQTVGKFDAFKPEQLLYWCPSCDQHLAKAQQDQLSETTKRRVSVTTFLAGQSDRMAFTKAVPKKLALHWHGGIAEQEQDAAAVIFLLSKVPGLEIIDMPSVLSVGRHCTDTNIQRGGEEAYRSLQAEWTRLARERGADHIASIYHSCHRELLHSQQSLDEKSRLPVVNYLAVLAEAMELTPREDKYAKYVESGDVEAIADELEARAKERGINPDHARRAIVANFSRRP